jgi:hypothetical protein
MLIPPLGAEKAEKTMAKMNKADMEKLIEALGVDAGEGLDAALEQVNALKKKAAKGASAPAVPAGTPYVTPAGKVAIKGYTIRLWMDEVPGADEAWEGFMKFYQEERDNPETEAFNKKEGIAALKERKEANKKAKGAADAS